MNGTKSGLWFLRPVPIAFMVCAVGDALFGANALRAGNYLFAAVFLAPMIAGVSLAIVWRRKWQGEAERSS